MTTAPRGWTRKKSGRGPQDSPSAGWADSRETTRPFSAMSGGNESKGKETMTGEASPEDYLLKPEAVLEYIAVAPGWKRKQTPQSSPMLWFESKQHKLLVSVMAMEAASGDIEISLSPARKNGKSIRREQIERVRRDFLGDYENVKLRVQNPVFEATRGALTAIMAVTATDSVIEGPGELI